MRTVILLVLIFMASTQIQAQKSYPKTTISVDIQSTLSLKETFEYIVPIDLEHIFKRYKNIPAVDSTSNKEAWYTPGMTRMVFFDDGTSSKETLLSVTPHSAFTYKVNGFTNSLKGLIKQINGSWTFTETENGKIHIEWTYEFIPRNFFARFLVNIIVKKRIKTPMTNALTVMKDELESGNLYRYERKVGNW
ncbi:SRPBCC family protein [Aggregatimonas sangjinii]|uniref:SRPBCC family protein n=1 Tax=Aggregatimonas sangjinii TaxID=2583587 RepID=A0A5B7SRU7_9FLAO|nr:SRPBCC family protein [Aggregatimonas sangjinii]QCX01415.1 SRPBCC family protein [Aggregatimonas sangjinii]